MVARKDGVDRLGAREEVRCQMPPDGVGAGKPFVQSLPFPVEYGSSYDGVRIAQDAWRPGRDCLRP